MANEQKQPAAAAQDIKQGQGRSASYPSIDLKSAEERAKQFWGAEKNYEVPLSSAFKSWGYGPKSSGARLAIAAMLNYGLMSDRGSNEQRMVRLTPLGVDLMMAPTPEARLKTLKLAALRPKVFADLLRTMDPENLPSDQTIAHYLVTQKGFNPSGAETFIKTFKGTLKHAQLKKSDTMTSGETPLPPPEAGQSGSLATEVNMNSSAQPQQTPFVGQYVPPPPAQKGFKQDVYHFGDGGQVILQWPEGMSKESFEEFKDWIALEMRKIGRVVSSGSEGGSE